MSDFLPANDLVEEVLTIGTSRVGITDAILLTGDYTTNPVGPRPIGALRARFQHISGDPVFHSTLNGSAPSLTGANGEDYSVVGSTWIIKAGVEKLTDWGAIVESGGSSATIKVTIEGRE
jgi:hypothetical protein